MMTMINNYFQLIRGKMKKTGWIPVITLLLIITSGKIGMAQEKDYGTWLTVDVTKELTKRLDLELEEEVRIVGEA